MLQLKKPALAPEESDRQVRVSVEAMLEDIGQRGETAIRELALKFDNWEGEFVLSQEKKNALLDSVPDTVKKISSLPTNRCFDLPRYSATACNPSRSKLIPG